MGERVKGFEGPGLGATIGPERPVHDARRVPDGATIDCDVRIVGTGAAGVTLALALGDMPVRIRMLEAGGMLRDETTHSQNRIVCEGLESL